MLAMLLTLALEAGPEVWSSAVSVGPGQKKTLKASGLTVGASYELVTRGDCVHLGKGKVKRWRDRVSPDAPDPFGVEFQVTVGAQAFSVDAEERHTLVRAGEVEPTITIEDRSATSTRARCTLTFVGLRRI